MEKNKNNYPHKNEILNEASKLVQKAQKKVKEKPIQSTLIAALSGWLVSKMLIKSSFNAILRLFELVSLIQSPLIGLSFTNKAKEGAISGISDWLVLFFARALLVFLLWVSMWILFMAFLLKNGISLVIVLSLFFSVNIFFLLICHFFLNQLKDKINKL